MKRRPDVVEYVIGATPYGAPIIARHYVYQENSRKKKKVLDDYMVLMPVCRIIPHKRIKRKTKP